MTIRRPLLLLWLFAPPLLSTSPIPAAADDKSGGYSVRLVNLDTAAIAPQGSVAGSLDTRLVNGPEDIVFTSLIGRYGLTRNLEVGVRAVTGTTHTLNAVNGASITYGGRDVEIYGKYGLGGFHGVRLALQGGVSFPGTPAQNQATGTLGGIGEVQLGERVTAYLNPRAVLLKNNSIFGIGIGASLKVADNVSVVGDWTGIAAGCNTLSTVDASRQRTGVWGVALRLNSALSHAELDLGWGNATGSTTGSSLTPGIGNASGLYFALRARR